jgi:hypothetical protein
MITLKLIAWIAYIGLDIWINYVIIEKKQGAA